MGLAISAQLFLTHQQKVPGGGNLQMQQFSSIQVDGTFVTVDAMSADSLISCVAQCQVRATCTVVEFTGSPNSIPNPPPISTSNCKGLKRDSDELGRAYDSVGVKVLVDANWPSKSISALYSLYFLCIYPMQPFNYLRNLPNSN